MITDSQRSVLQEALNQRVSEGRMSVTECDRLSALVWGTDNVADFHNLWDTLATDSHPTHRTDPPMPGNPVIDGQPQQLHRTGHWKVKGYEHLTFTNTEIYLDLVDARWTYPSMTLDFACTACTITIVVPQGMKVHTNLRYRYCELTFPSTLPVNYLPILCVQGKLEGTDIQVVYF